MCIECGCGLDAGLSCPEYGGRMVLVNNQATCLECGATPSTDEHLVEREEHHHHHHHDEHTHGETVHPDDLIGLRVLLPHWIAHNEEHADSFRQ